MYTTIVWSPQIVTTIGCGYHHRPGHNEIEDLQKILGHTKRYVHHSSEHLPAEGEFKIEKFQGWRKTRRSLRFLWSLAHLDIY